MYKITVYSPLKPLLFKQKVTTNTDLKGYFKANLLHQLSGKKSYKASIESSTLELHEQKTEKKKRTWHLFTSKQSQSKLLGTLIMDSTAKDTLNEGHTSFTFTFENEVFTIKKELMDYKSKCSLVNSSNQVVASHYPSGLSQRKIELNQKMTHQQSCAILLVLSLIVFVA
ncbi:tubby C-terminal domain-like protein [Alkalicoccobacillus murimartini]|uniref:Tubby C-terminal domain-containing protein n=1 Tax=Alkalicoccobacillus murimartini TaxID=171685 RepID=A0ABT9YLK5_9BACI|nr:hypothetical protein [Alkalicoccobacillus murimartini]MDQ0208742.1 hypothetical protein [Alkalicoccobacillus murimartini]